MSPFGCDLCLVCPYPRRRAGKTDGRETESPDEPPWRRQQHRGRHIPCNQGTQPPRRRRRWFQRPRQPRRRRPHDEPVTAFERPAAAVRRCRTREVRRRHRSPVCRSHVWALPGRALCNGLAASSGYCLSCALTRTRPADGDEDVRCQVRPRFAHAVPSLRLATARARQSKSSTVETTPASRRSIRPPPAPGSPGTTSSSSRSGASGACSSHCGVSPGLR